MKLYALLSKKTNRILTVTTELDIFYELKCTLSDSKYDSPFVVSNISHVEAIKNGDTLWGDNERPYLDDRVNRDDLKVIELHYPKII